MPTGRIEELSKAFHKAGLLTLLPSQLEGTVFLRSEIIIQESFGADDTLLANPSTTVFGHLLTQEFIESYLIERKIMEVFGIPGPKV